MRPGYAMTSALGRNPWTKGLGLLFVGLAMLATAPGPYNAFDHRLDPSYQWALNRAAADGLVHGRDFTFNYGPFGYLLFPLDIGSNLLWSLIVQWALWALLAATLIGIARRGAPPWSVMVLGAGVAIAQGLGLQTEYLWLYTCALVLTLSLDGHRRSAFAGGLAGALAAFLLFVKFSTGMAASGMVVVAVLVLLEARTRASVRALSVLAASWIAVFVTVLLGHFRSVRDFARWSRLSLEIAGGYSTAMSLQGRPAELWLGIGLLLCFVMVAVLWLRLRSGSLRMVVVFFLPVALAYKHAFVRQATHAHVFFPVALVFVATLVPLADGERSRKVAAALLGVSIALVGAEAALRRPVGVSSFVAGAGGLDGLRRAVSLLHLSALRRELAERSRENLKEERLPAEWLETMRREEGGVDVIPYELSLLPANDLAWRPNPVLQTYNAYTRLLDLACAQHFQGPHAPRFVILHMATIDVRHPLADAPATSRALLSRYRPAGVDEGAQRVLLRLQTEPVPRTSEPPPLEHRELLGEWIDVPPSAVPLAADMSFRPSLRERILKVLFRVPAVSMEVQYEDGRVLPLRILPDTAAGGLPISHLPRDAAAAAALFARAPTARVTRFRVGGLGAILYDPEFTVRWTALTAGPEDGRASGSAPVVSPGL